MVNSNLTLDEIETIFDVKHGKKSHKTFYLVGIVIALIVIAVGLYIVLK